VVQLVDALRYMPYMSRFRFPMVSQEFFFYIILPAALWFLDWFRLLQKWVPGIFHVRGKCGRCVRLTNLPPSCTHFLGIFSGTFRACPGLYRNCFTIFYCKGLSARCNKSFFVVSQALRKLTFRHDPVLPCDSDRLTAGFTQFFSTLRIRTWRSPYYSFQRLHILRSAVYFPYISVIAADISCVRVQWNIEDY
jgi:hypothetical protein